MKSQPDAIRHYWLPDKIIRQGESNKDFYLSEMSYFLGIVLFFLSFFFAITAHSEIVQ